MVQMADGRCPRRADAREGVRECTRAELRARIGGELVRVEVLAILNPLPPCGTLALPLGALVVREQVR